MLQYEKGDVLEGIDVDKASASKGFVTIGFLKMLDLNLKSIDVMIY